MGGSMALVRLCPELIVVLFETCRDCPQLYSFHALFAGHPQDGSVSIASSSFGWRRNMDRPTMNTGR